MAQNDEEAVQWLRKAADQEYVDTQYILGMLVAQCHGVGKIIMRQRGGLRRPLIRGILFQNVSSRTGVSNKAYYGLQLTAREKGPVLSFQLLRPRAAVLM